MNHRISAFELIKDYLVEIRFEDGLTFNVDLKEYLNKGFAKELLDKTKFSEIYNESGGGLAWPNGFDICPNFLRELMNKNSEKKVSA